MASELPDFSVGLNAFFRGKAKWRMERNVIHDSYTLGFQCERLTPVIEVSHTALTDASDTAGLLARQCLDLYERHHRTIGAWKQEPILTCRKCRSSVDLPREQKLDFEFCERQSVLWAERAAAMSR